MTQSEGALDTLLQRAGSDIFRLAVLLAPDQSQAAAALLRAVRALARSQTPVYDERRLVASLLDAVPASPRRSKAAPAWTRAVDVPEMRALLADLAQLPAQQRLALAADALPTLDAVFADDAAARDAARREALGRLSRHALPAGEALPPLLGDEVPEACRPARAALAHSAEATHADPAIRGHLALCAECRAAAQAWRAVTLRVDEALRAALRDVAPPPGLAAQLIAAARPGQRRPLRDTLRGPLALRALVPLAVILAIGALVWPRPAPAEAPATSAAAPVAPAELVRRAAASLYDPPETTGTAVWQARYAIRWYFADSSFANLEGTLWLDEVRGRHRVQLVHEAGGGPFEIQLADGRETLWYSVEPRYAASIYPQLADQFAPKVELSLDADQQREMLGARLSGGAWAIPADYLRQAAAADELRSWGRRTSEDGADLVVLSFRGASALGLPDGAPGADAEVTVLLSIDTASGRLYEVRELVGPDAGEQTGRTVWRYLGGEWVVPTPMTEREFDPGAVTGMRGGFAMLPEGAASPELPIVPASAVRPLVRGLDSQRLAPLVPASAPPGVTSAALIVPGGRDEATTVVYLGGGRSLAIMILPRLITAPSGGAAERVQLEAGPAWLTPGPLQRYDVVLNAPGGPNGAFYPARVSAEGFSRDELLGVLRSLGPLSIDAVRSQYDLFVGPQPGDRAAFGALLDALAERPPPEPGIVSYRVETMFARQAPYPDALRDPYHLPLYEGRPEELTIETWTRVVDGGLEQVSVTRGADGTVFDRSYDGPGGSWWHNVARSEVQAYPWSLYLRPLDWGARAAERLLVCGASLATDDSGARIVARSESGWRRGSCVAPYYADLIEMQGALVLQRSDGGAITVWAQPGASGDVWPFISDQPDTELNHQLWLGSDGRVTRSEVSVPPAGGAGLPTVLERWELVREERLPAERVAETVFQAEPPQALMRVAIGGDGPAPPQALEPLEIADARERLAGGLYLPSDQPAEDGTRLQLESIYTARFDSEQIYSSTFTYPDPFEDALYHAAAIRTELWLFLPDGSRLLLPVFQGPAEQFGAFLRARARWAASEPARLTIAGGETDVWLVNTADGRRWALAELGDTLIAAPASFPHEIEALALLTQP